MIVILGYSEIDIEILEICVKITEFKEILRVNRITNSILATIYNELWFLYKDEQKVVDLFT